MTVARGVPMWTLTTVDKLASAIKNTCLKTRTVDNPYEIWQTPYTTVGVMWEWRVLKKWQLDDDKPYARWFCAVRSPYTHGSWEYGDVYVSEIKATAVRVKGD